VTRGGDDTAPPDERAVTVDVSALEER
jgi:hypothetical protein